MLPSPDYTALVAQLDLLRLTGKNLVRMTSSLSKISRRILEVMEECPEGITEGEIRERLKIPATDQANFGRKRVRELRYLGWNIPAPSRKKQAGGRVKSFYRVIESKPWPDDPTGFIRRHERERAERNKRLNREPSIE